MDTRKRAELLQGFQRCSKEPAAGGLAHPRRNINPVGRDDQYIGGKRRKALLGTRRMSSVN